MKDKSPVIMSISTMKDIQELKKSNNIKYLNIDITSPDLEVIYYLIENGKNYSYSDMLDGKRGYIYVSYDVFRESELLLLDIINNIPITLDELEISKYLYIKVGKILGYDINIFPDKNETFNLKEISTVNNIWGSINKRKGTNVSFTKVYLYLCRIMAIDCNLVSVNDEGYLQNSLSIKNKTIITDITKDIPFIEANFKTSHFLGYNDNLELDKKINYIKDNYSELKIEESLKNVEYNKDTTVIEILLKTQDIIKASEIKPIELGIIYDIIFKKFCPNYDIYINNLFINDTYNEKEHFVLICYSNKYYSFNYIRNSFVEISSEEIIKNIENNKIGIYENEIIPKISIKKEGYSK